MLLNIYKKDININSEKKINQNIICTKPIHLSSFAFIHYAEMLKGKRINEKTELHQF